jgi:hypothetical protein
MEMENWVCEVICGNVKLKYEKIKMFKLILTYFINILKEDQEIYNHFVMMDNESFLNSHNFKARLGKVLRKNQSKFLTWISKGFCYFVIILIK